jgi:chlorite dismutase
LGWFVFVFFVASNVMSDQANPIPDLSEKGRDAAGNPISLDRRLYMQLLAFGHAPAVTALVSALKASKVTGALYVDVNDPSGVALVAAHESPDFFITDLRRLLTEPPFSTLTPKPEYTMIGRSYSSGYESDLEHVLIKRPLHRLCNPEWPWAIWYPLRRGGAFEKLSAQEQRAIMIEHGNIGATFTAGGHGYDIRLACHGLDKNDNDFLIGLIGKELFPLSAMVQAMRKTRQTSEFLENLGPFFVGKAVWQSAVAMG